MKNFLPNTPYTRFLTENTVKVSYSCMPNVKQIIDGHNKSKLSKSSTTENETACNCQKKNECPLSNKCTTLSVVYQATVTTTGKTFDKPPQTYIGLAENSFKTRYANHKASFNFYNKRNSTELSKFVRELKSNKIDYKIKWKILRHARPYNPASNRCNLCLWEKYYIICKPWMATLNKRNELVSSCRHYKKLLLKNI